MKANFSIVILAINIDLHRIDLMTGQEFECFIRIVDQLDLEDYGWNVE